MSDTPATQPTNDIAGELASVHLRTEGLHSLGSAVELIDRAIGIGIAAADGFSIGDHGELFRKPNGDVEIIDVRRFEDEPRLPSFITATPKFVSVESLARYVARHQLSDQTVAYIADTYGKGIRLLTADNDVAWVTIDDHPILDTTDLPSEQLVGRQAHTASLVLRPTEPAKRWGAALSANHVGQEAFLDLIVDGITEIAEPDGAVLRDLVSDLHAIRTSEVQSVVRTGGEGSIELKENVKLHAGTGTQVSFPETMQVTFVPFVGLSKPVVLKVRIKPEVVGNKVVFSLTCAQLEQQLATVMGDLAASIAEHTNLNPLWRP
jgi:uncharacterized protein YfdQ (DUF2303 family)